MRGPYNMGVCRTQKLNSMINPSRIFSYSELLVCFISED
jgi:hypothetical protein